MVASALVAASTLALVTVRINGQQADQREGGRQAWVGPAETILGPTQLVDSPYHTLESFAGVVGFTANERTVAYDVTPALKPRPTPVLVPGPATFDRCGTWLNSTMADGAVVRGWYHAETCDEPPLKSVGYAQAPSSSLDFSKPGYPNSRVISAPDRYSTPREASEGDHHVVRVGDDLRLYFLAGRDGQIHMARSPRGDGGVPGSWTKLHRGRFDSPGVGGESTALAPDVLATSWVTHLKGEGRLLGFAKDERGLALASSADGITGWRQVTGALLLRARPQWKGRTASSGELIAYPSMIGLTGDTEAVDREFWLYYMQVRPGEDFADGRYLVRRRVALGPEAQSGQPARIALTRYVAPGRGVAWTTTTNPSPDFQAERTLGYLLTEPGDSTSALYDCLRTEDGQHFVSTRADCKADREPAAMLRLLGWVADDAGPGLTPLYACPTGEVGEASAACPEGEASGIVGYLAGGPPPDVVRDDGYWLR